MANTYSSNLRLIIQTTGENAGTWGTYTNTNIATLLEQAITGIGAIAVSGSSNYTLNTANGASDESRNAILNVTGTLTAAINIVCPTVSKTYIIKNGTTGGYAVTLKTSAGTGISVPNGSTMFLYCDGTNVVEAVNYQTTGKFSSLTDTGLTSGRVTYAGTGGLLQDSTNLTFDGTTLTAGGLSGPHNGTVGATTPSTGAFTTLSASSTVSGTGFSTYLASPPAIGGTTPAAGAFTTLSYTGTLTGGTGVINIGSGQVYKDASGNVGIGTSSPTTWGKFAVVGVSSGGQVVAAIANTSGTANTQAVLSFDTTNNGFNVRDSQIRATNNGGNQTTLEFYTANSATPVERMRIDSSGTFRVKGAGTAGSTDAVQFSGSAPASSMIFDSYGNLHVPGGSGIASNEAFGTGALRNNTTGTQNTASGQAALYSNTTGNNNTASGQNSLYYNTTGIQNTASGQDALHSNTTGNNNTASGQNSLYYNTTGYNNTASGQNALHSNTTGNNNTASGYQALYNSGKTVTAGSFVVGIAYTIQSIGTTDFTLIGAASNTVGVVFTTTGVGTGTGTASSNTNNNSAFGFQALQANTTGYNSTANGAYSLLSNTTGYQNTASGAYSLQNNTTGIQNTAYGLNSLNANTTGSQNTAIGLSALISNTTGTNNTSLGYSAGNNITTGANNTVIGANASASSATVNNEITLGNSTQTMLRIPPVITGYTSAAPTIASAATIAPTTPIVFVSGTTAVATITAPAPISSGGGQITIIPTGLFTTTTAGNIALASTAVVSKALIMTYDATTAKWYPSY